MEMNNFLASIMGFLNGFMALLFIVSGALIGQQMDANLGGNGLVAGLAIGLGLAVIFCGILAIFISMRGELVEIRKLLGSSPK